MAPPQLRFLQGCEAESCPCPGTPRRRSTDYRQQYQPTGTARGWEDIKTGFKAQGFLRASPLLISAMADQKPSSWARVSWRMAHTALRGPAGTGCLGLGGPQGWGGREGDCWGAGSEDSAGGGIRCIPCNEVTKSQGLNGGMQSASNAVYLGAMQFYRPERRKGANAGKGAFRQERCGKENAQLESSRLPSRLHLCNSASVPPSGRPRGVTRETWVNRGVGRRNWHGTFIRSRRDSSCLPLSRIND